MLFFKHLIPFSLSLSLSLFSSDYISPSDSAGLNGVVVDQPDDVPQLGDTGEQRLGSGVELRSLGSDGAVGLFLQRGHFLFEERDLFEDLLGLRFAEFGLDDRLVLGDDLEGELRFYLGDLFVFSEREGEGGKEMGRAGKEISSNSKTRK